VKEELCIASTLIFYQINIYIMPTNSFLKHMVLCTLVIASLAACRKDTQPVDAPDASGLLPDSVTERATTYNVIPAVGVFTSISGGTLSGACGSFTGGEIRAKVISVTGSLIKIRIYKVNGQNFSAGGTAYVKAVTVCGTIAGQANYSAGQSYAEVNINATFTSGLTHFYPVIVATGGARYFSDPVIVWAQWANPPYSHGTWVGTVNGVDLYGNGSNVTYTSGYNYVSNFNTGYKWQCVEFINRYYYQIYGMNIRQNGGHAYQYFGSAASRGLIAYANGNSNGPKVGDILCFSGNTYGHVAIITEVGSNFVKVAQQNVVGLGHIQFSLSKTGNTISASNLGSGYTVQGWLRKP